MNPVPSTKGRKLVKINKLTQAHLLKLLLPGTRTCVQLAEESGLHYVTVLNHTRALHRAGVVHIAHYETDRLGRDIQKVYRLGEGEDAKRHRLTDAEKSSRYRARRARGNLQQQITNALFGAPHARTDAVPA